ncbi:MAG: YicC/YloC family endoribonuclease [Deltaproteobacteria bacterium]
MTLNSMTGFGRADGSVKGVRWYWEAKSVNGRGLDIRVRLPQGHDQLEPKVREAVAKRFVRGSLTLSLNAQRDVAAVDIKVNEAALAQIISAVEQVRRLTGAAAPSAEGLLALRGVLDVSEADGALDEEVAAAMLASLEDALQTLAEARAAEGRRLTGVLEALVGEIEKLTRQVQVSPSRQPEAIRVRLREQIARLTDAAPALDPARLHQEAILIATRSDVEEEVQRLTAHVASARALLVDRQPAGRKLDFLAQEFNREANTLTSKAIDMEITRAGLALKTVIDQLREQVQNIE